MAHRSLLLLVAALVCFVVAFLLAVDAFSGSHFDAWIAAGFVALTAAFVSDKIP